MRGIWSAVLAYDFVETFGISFVDYPLSHAFYRGLRVDVENKLLSHESRVELVRIFKENMERRTGYNRGERTVLSKALKRVAFDLAGALREKHLFRAS